MSLPLGIVGKGGMHYVFRLYRSSRFVRSFVRSSTVHDISRTAGTISIKLTFTGLYP